MKRILFLATCLTAFSAPAFGQANDIPKHEKECTDEQWSAARNAEGIIHLRCYNLNSDDVITVRDRIGNTQTSDLTSASSVLVDSKMQARGQANVADYLRTLPGVSVNQSGPAGALTQIRIRGSEASHTLVIIDGVEVSNPNSGEFDFAGLRAEDIVRIEVLRGEQSALYGSDAIAGVINIITRAGESTERYAASFEAGSFDTAEGQFSAVIPVKGAALSINGNAFKTGGYDISGLGGEKDGSQSRALNVGLNNVKIGGVTLSGKFGYARLLSEFDSDTDFDGRLNNTNSESERDSYTGRVDARFDFAGLDHLITASLSEITTDTNGAFGNVSVGRREQINWAAKTEFGNNNSLTVLAETERETYSITPSFAGAPIEPENRNSAIAADYRFDNDTLTLTASARQDFNERFDDAFTWRVGAGYAFDWDGRLRASVGKGVKNPSLIELFGFFPDSNFTGNPDLTPEKSIGFNVGYEQTFEAFDFAIDYFKSDLTDEIFTDFSSFPFLPRNRATDSTREGIEFEASWDADPVFLSASATVLDAEENGVREIRRPEFLASGTARWDVTDALSLTVSADHTGAQIDTDFGTFSPVELDAFTLVGLNAAYAVNDRVTLSLRGENLLDEDYQEVVGYASQGRGIYAGVSASF